ncbi:hypothetical protein BH18ACT5_BH18ACT5_14810 [soil metagenome]
MPSEFEIDTAVEGGNGHYQATVTDRWSIGGRANGGYLQSIAVGAIGLEVPQPDLLTSTAPRRNQVPRRSRSTSSNVVAHSLTPERS